ncbi:MAG: YihA family ribosome biogenesis GTP-binding protein [Oscillospiraceae bacterium]|nr:YihA family ribosome biogenesis GTP-binding protein [Oscillospiraceae bacterium]MCI9364656.1 YihA family ribosome biogenesis GTP-binding protein [Oscillospiraceae bacterium]RKJ58278.1 YihA family ribosome biogenesis GTP-binding protein [bacterium 1XD42-8]RKJ66890.1 YihA family ribosome biogenesis GTP-binding protein [bacterium 1XD42-1]
MNHQNVIFEKSFGISAQLPTPELPELAFAGRSNVGKSSMLNRLFNRKQLARVSAVPGKTSTINFFRAEGIHFVDLPGYGYAKVSKSEKKRWSELIEGYFAQDRDLRIVFQLIDMRHPPTEDDLTMINFLIDGGFPFAVILTKADKLNKTQRQNRLESITQELPCGDQIVKIPFSSQTGEGVEAVWEIIEEIATEGN